MDDEQVVDSSSIEKSLADLWRGETLDGGKAVLRAALWNVVAHTWEQGDHANASETLSKASAVVPQRSIVIRSTPDGPSEMSSWISANCHLVGREKQVCSEEVAIVAGGARIHHVPPLVNALLIPDMPVAVWWLGDLPSEHEGYVESLLDPADRLIVDSSHFDQPADLRLVAKIAQQTTTAPADLNWVRLEEWRAATASIFDPPRMRERARSIRAIRIAGAGGTFGRSAESLLYAAWISSQLGHEVEDGGVVAHGEIDYQFSIADGASGIQLVEMRFADDSIATISRDRDRGVLMTSIDGTSSTSECITRVLARGPEDLIVRQLQRPEADRVFIRALPIATRLAKRLG